MMVARRPRKTQQTESAASAVPAPRLPKNALARLNVGLSFAENDAALRDENVYVQTPAISAATNAASGKFFFVVAVGPARQHYALTASASYATRAWSSRKSSRRHPRFSTWNCLPAQKGPHSNRLSPP